VQQRKGGERGPSPSGEEKEDGDEEEGVRLPSEAMVALFHALGQRPTATEVRFSLKSLSLFLSVCVCVFVYVYVSWPMGGRGC
jgi:hypothetical protein